MSLAKNIKLPYPHVLYFHSIEKVDDNHIGVNKNIRMSPSEFELTIKLLTSYFKIIPLKEVKAKLNNGEKFSFQEVAITFDDGFKDNFTRVLPILKKYKVPATVFVTTGFIQKKIFPYEFILANYYESSKAKNAVEKYEEIKKLLKHKSHYERIKNLENYIPNFGKFKSKNLFLSWDNLRELANNDLVELGIHSYSHIPLPVLDNKDLRFEILGPKIQLFQNTGIKTQYISYPYGEITTQILTQYIQNNFELGFCTENPPYVRKRNQKLVIPRVEVRGVKDIYRLKGLQ